MSADTLIAILLVTWAAIAFLFALILRHMSTCNAREREMGTLLESVAHIKRQIGDSDSGLVRSLHDFKTEIRTALYKRGDQR